MAVVTGQAVVLKGTNGLSILLGSGPPSASDGVDGQPGYLDQTNNLLYGPKVAGAWPAVGNQFGGNLLLYAGKPPDNFGSVGNLSLDITAGFIYGPRSASAWPAQPLLALVGPQGAPGPVGPAAAVNNDPTLNSLVLSPVAGDANAVQLAIKNSAGAVLWGVDTNGNEVVGGTLNVTGNATFNAAFSAKVATVTGVVNSGNETIAGTLNVTGPSTMGTAKVTTLNFNDGTSQTTAASGTGSGTSLDTIYMGLHNAASGNYPTAYTASNGYFTNTQYVNSTNVLNTGSAYISDYAGTVFGIKVFAVTNSQPITVALYKNGTITSLTATSTTSGGGFYTRAPTGSPITVAAGDLLQLFIKGTTASMTNSCIGWVTVKPNATP